jgi:plastocyanin
LLLHFRSKPTIAVVAVVTLVVPLQAVAAQRHRVHRQAQRHRVQSHRGPARSLSASRPQARKRDGGAGWIPKRIHAGSQSHHARAESRAGRARRGAPAGAASNFNAALTLNVFGPGTHRRAHTAHAAGDPGDTISDFKFSPATITIHVGDTITWTNVGPTEHTATANNGSFNTGILKKGASASHTFTQAGTFAYICTIHPFMHGTVVVVGNTASSTPTTSAPATTTPTSSPSTSATTASNSTSSGSSAPATSGAATLPVTGLGLERVAAAGALLLGAGLLIRRKLRTR